MKRISVLAMIVCMLCVSHARAWDSYTPLRYRVRYSPQAFGYHHSGLIPGDARYSMQAVGKNHSGLVPNWIRYSPYAFGTRHNGLIVDYGSSSNNWWLTPMVAGFVQNVEIAGTPVDVVKPKRVRHSPPPARLATKRIRRKNTTRASTWKRPSRLNQRRTIQNVLQQTCPNGYRFARSFKVDSEYASFDVLLNNGNVIVKYWNPGFIAELKQSEGGIAKRYDRYVQSWSQMRASHEARGGKVYDIVSNDTDQVMQQLCQIVESTSSADRVYCAALPPVGP